jgi:hypothetical protein
MKYLIDSLQSYESGHGNALYPICTEPEKSFMGDHITKQAVTAEEFREMKCSVDRKLDDLVGALHSGLSMGVIPCPAIQPGGINHGPIRNAPGRDIRRIASTPYLSAPPKPIEDDSTNNCDAPLRYSSRPIPIACVHIPDVGHGRGGWRKAVEQWEQGSPDMPRGLALKDWPKEWYTKGMASAMGVKRSQRKLIADEYVRCVPKSHHRNEI